MVGMFCSGGSISKPEHFCAVQEAARDKKASSMDQPRRRTIIVPHLLREEYPLFLAGMPKDGRLPRSYEEWYKEAVSAHKSLRAAGCDSERVMVRWDEFKLYADRMRLQPDAQKEIAGRGPARAMLAFAGDAHP